MSTTASTNPFAQEEAWAVGGGILGPGQHLCEVLEVKGDGNSSGGHPQIEVTVGNADGDIRDWIVVIPRTIGKVVQLTDALGLPRPADDQVVPEGTGFRLAPAYVAQMKGKKVGVVVREEADQQDPTRKRNRVQGYIPASSVSDDFAAAPAETAPASISDNDIPF